MTAVNSHEAYLTGGRTRVEHTADGGSSWQPVTAYEDDLGPATPTASGALLSVVRIAGSGITSTGVPTGAIYRGRGTSAWTLSTLEPSPHTGTATLSPISKCCIASRSPQLTVTLNPLTGPPGTVVHIQGSGCLDAGGQNHAVSFNNDAQNPSARNNPNTVRTIASALINARITAAYKIVPSDSTGGVGTVFVQCGATVRTADFKVVK